MSADSLTPPFHCGKTTPYAHIQIAVTLWDVPGISGELSVKKPQVTISVLIIVSEFFLYCCNQSFPVSWIGLSEKGPVDGTISAAGSHYVFTAERVINNVTTICLSYMLYSMLLYVHVGPFEQPIIELISSYGILPGPDRKSRAEKMNIEPVNGQKAVRVLLSCHLQVLNCLWCDPAGTDLEARKPLFVNDNGVNAAAIQSPGTG